MALIHTSTLTDHISIFTGIPRETLEAAELKNLEKISLALSFLSIAPKFDRTERVGPYTMPEDVTIKSTGQFENLAALLRKMPKDPMTEPEKFADLCLHACAIYCQKLRDGKFESERVPMVKEELKEYSCGEVIGTGAFFLFRPVNLSQPITKVSLTFIQLMRRSRLACIISQKIFRLRQRFSGSAVK